VGLGEVRFAKGLYADAERHFAEALRIEPGLPEAHKGLALTLLRRKDIPAAAQHLKEMLEAKPTAPAHYDLANLLAKQGKTAEAVQHLREALRLDPNLAPAHTSLGMALEELGRADQAHGHYAEALRLAPGDTTARGKLALLLLRRGSYDQAVHHYRQLLQAQPDRVDALYNISFALVSLSQYGQAATYLARAVQQKPTPQGHHDLAALLSRQGRSRTAIAHYRQALRMQPGWPPAEAGLAWELATAAEGELRDPAEAVKLAASACQQTGHKNARFLDILAAALAAEGQFARAVDTAEEAIPLAPAATNERLAKQLQERIALYRAHKPYRQGRTATAPAPARP
jgi:tetratricopeptide (TPR) repeat protein